MGTGAVQGVGRGCGTRQEGGIYLECGTRPGRGQPLEFFLADPPVPMTCDSKVGVELIERGGVVHILDWVGEQHYPFVTDFLEEGRALGFSRRISGTLDLFRLTAESRILVVHARGLVVNHEALRPFMPERYNAAHNEQGRGKPAHQHHCGHLERTASLEHYRPDPHTHRCTRDLWAVPPASRVVVPRRGGYAHGTPPRYVREFASISYEVFPLAPDAPAPEYVAALVASLPITNVSVIKAKDGSHRGTLEKVKEMFGRGPGAARTIKGGLRISVIEADA
jgi:hypothetical protein